MVKGYFQNIVSDAAARPANRSRTLLPAVGRDVPSSIQHTDIEGSSSVASSTDKPGSHEQQSVGQAQYNELSNMIMGESPAPLASQVQAAAGGSGKPDHALETTAPVPFGDNAGHSNEAGIRVSQVEVGHVDDSVASVHGGLSSSAAAVPAVDDRIESTIVAGSVIEGAREAETGIGEIISSPPTSALEPVDAAAPPVSHAEEHALPPPSHTSDDPGVSDGDDHIATQISTESQKIQNDIFPGDGRPGLERPNLERASVERRDLKDVAVFMRQAVMEKRIDSMSSSTGLDHSRPVEPMPVETGDLTVGYPGRKAATGENTANTSAHTAQQGKLPRTQQVADLNPRHPLPHPPHQRSQQEHTERRSVTAQDLMRNLNKSSGPDVPQIKKGTGSAPGANLPGQKMQQVEVVIGQIDVIVEAPAPAPRTTTTAPKPRDISSKYYLRGL